MKNLICFITLFLQSYTVHAANISIQPLYLEFSQDPKVNEQPFSIKVNSDAAAHLKVSLYESKQNILGFLDFIEVNKAKSESQIVIKEHSHKFLRAGSWEISGIVKYVKGIKDTRALALMVEEVKDSVSTGVGISVRYAIVFKIKNSTSRTLENGEILFNNYFVEDNKVFLKATFENKSNQDFDLQTIATVRDKNKKLIENVALESLAAWKRKDHKTLIMPNTKVELIGKSEKLKFKESYLVTIYSRINGKKQITANGEIEFNHNILNTRSEKNISFNPEKISINTNNKNGGMFRFEIKNDFEENIEIIFVDQNKEGLLSLVQAFPNKVIIPKNKKRNAVFKVAPMNLDNEIKKISINAIVKNFSGQILKKIQIPVELVNE